MIKRTTTLFIAGLMAVLLTCGCGGETTQETTSFDEPPAKQAQPAASAMVPAPVDRERGGPTAVTITWQGARSGMVLRSSDTLTVEITNQTDSERSVSLVTVASGLDGRLITHPLDQVSLAGGAQQRLRIAVADLPLQADGSPAFVSVTAEIERDANDEPTRVPTPPLYYVFGKDYSEAVFYDQIDIVGIQPADPSTVRGRVLEPDGTWTEVSGTAGQGASWVTAAPPRSEPPPALRTTTFDSVGTVAQAITSSVKLCTTWRVQYTDSNFGEDYFATTQWQDVPAAFASLQIQNNSPVTPGIAWSGFLDFAGCAQVPLTNGSYTITQLTLTGWNGIQFDSRTPSGGSFFTQGVNTNINVPNTSTSSITVHPTFNSDAVQATAVTGRILVQHGVGLFFGLGGMGIVPGVYSILANTGCGAPVDPPTDSCYDPMFKQVHLGTTLVNGVAEAHWKFIIAHEIGHQIQDNAMGSHSFGYSDSATQALCKCDHYTTAWGNKEHCLQSREIIGGSQIEGFAHAFATRTFNANEATDNSSRFVYYKPFKNVDNTVTFPPLRAFPVGFSRWMETNCVAAGRGIELDWLQFYYQVSAEGSANYTSFPKLFDIYRRTCTGSTATKCNSQGVSWSSLLSNALAYYGNSISNPSYVRFRDTGVNTGVDN